MKSSTRIAACAAVLLMAAAPAGAQQQKVTGPVATYWVSADTTSGMAGMMGGMGGNPGAAGQRPSAGAMIGGALGGSLGGALGGMMGGGRRGGGGQAAARPANYTHSLTLQLGSTQKAAGEPSAEHLPPTSLGAGPSLPLVTPRQAKPEPREPRDYTFNGERPKGRMLIYWGCGERAAAAPIVIDFSKIGPGMAPPNIPTINVNPGTPPSAGRFATYGEWPSEKTRTRVPTEGSLVGAHTVRGNYSPEINFSLGAGQDFMAPLTITGQSPSAGGGTLVTWNAVPNATGYFAQMMGMGGDEEEMVMWTSSGTASFFGMLLDYLPPSEVRRLIASRVVMSPQTTSCIVPREVIEKSPMGMFMMIAYGDEVNLADPPRPKDPKVAWDMKWNVKVRYKSTTSTMLGMPGMGY